MHFEARERYGSICCIHGLGGDGPLLILLLLARVWLTVFGKKQNLSVFMMVAWFHPPSTVIGCKWRGATMVGLSEVWNETFCRMSGHGTLQKAGMPLRMSGIVPKHHGRPMVIIRL